MEFERKTTSPVTTKGHLTEQDVRVIAAGSQHADFTKAFLDDVRTGQSNGSCRTAHSQWSKG